MKQTAALARAVLGETQSAQKEWYNAKVKACDFRQKQQVLLLLPSSDNTLQVKWLMLRGTNSPQRPQMVSCQSP